MAKEALKLSHAERKRDGVVVDVEVVAAGDPVATAASESESSDGTRTSRRPRPSVCSDELSSTSPSAAARTSIRTRVFVPSVRMKLLTSASALEVPDALDSPETATPPVSLTLTFSTVSAFAGGGALKRASATDIRRTFFIALICSTASTGQRG